MDQEAHVRAVTQVPYHGSLGQMVVAVALQIRRESQTHRRDTLKGWMLPEKEGRVKDGSNIWGQSSSEVEVSFTEIWN